MKRILKKTWLPLLICMAVTTVFYVIPVNGESEIYDKVIRLHVIANSDSEEDQALKLKVRDAILETVSGYTEGCADRAEAEAVIASHIEEIREQAEKTLRENGCTLSVSVAIGTENYPTREYEDVRLPAGEYCSLRVMIGEASGQNWWCVLFPPLCVGTASAKDELVSAGFTPDQVRILTDSDSPKYVLRFKILEILESLFS